MIDFVYAVKRTARRTLCVRIDEGNRITVTCPKFATKAQIEKFLQSKIGWINKNLSKNEAKNEAMARLIDYEVILVAGKCVPLKICDQNAILDGEVRAKSLKSLKKLYVEALGGQFLRLFKQICGASGLSCKGVQFKDYKSRWGCCDRNGQITFNYKLLMLPEKIWEYVTVHELAHTVHMNHSKNFYALVGGVMPDYKEAVAELKKYSRITRLY